MAITVTANPGDGTLTLTSSAEDGNAWSVTGGVANQGTDGQDFELNWIDDPENPSPACPRPCSCGP